MYGDVRLFRSNPDIARCSWRLECTSTPPIELGVELQKNRDKLGTWWSVSKASALKNFDKSKAAKIADGLKGQNLNDQLKNWHTLMAQPKINFGKLVDATVAIEKTIELYKVFPRYRGEHGQPAAPGAERHQG